MKENELKLIFFNQVAGPLFRELADDLSKVFHPSFLYTGHKDTILHYKADHFLKIKAGPVYNRKNIILRIFSWLHYFLAAFFESVWVPSGSLLVLATNPPFLGLLGIFWKLTRKQKYIILIYDISPEDLIESGFLKEGLLAKIWRFFNSFVFKNADLIFTISSDMEYYLGNRYGLVKRKNPALIYIPPWADVDAIKPIRKSDNWFIDNHNLKGKIVLLYSGNMGYSHDIEAILAAAVKLADEHGLHFLFCGEGAKRGLIENTKKEKGLKNITLLPFLPADTYPYCLAAADIGIVSYKTGMENFMIPSKSCYYMAAGLALLVISGEENDIARLTREHNCGMHIKNTDIEGMKLAILKMAGDPGLLEGYKKASRDAAVRFYSRKNTQLYINAIRNLSSFRGPA